MTKKKGNKKQGDKETIEEIACLDCNGKKTLIPDDKIGNFPELYGRVFEDACGTTLAVGDLTKKTMPKVTRQFEHWQKNRQKADTPILTDGIVKTEDSQFTDAIELSNLQPPTLQLNPNISTWRDSKGPDITLVRDIKEHGQLQAIIARKLPNGELEIIAGHRRYVAMRALGMKEADMKIDVRENVTDVEAVLMALAENKVRKDLTPLEEARAYQALKDLGLNTYEIGEKLGLGETTVREHMTLLELPKEIQDKIIAGKIKYSCARALIKLNEHPAEQKALAIDMAQGSRGGYQDWDAKSAERAVHEALEKLKEKQALVNKYGPCPQCNGIDLNKEWESNEKGTHLQCKKCGFSYNGNTKEPWAVSEIRMHAEKLGLKTSVTDGKVELNPKEISEVIETCKQAVKELEDPTLRSALTIDTIAARVLTDNVLSIKVDGDKVELKLKHDEQLHFLATPHEYQDGNKTKITIETGWQEQDGVLQRRPIVEKFLANLAAQTEPLEIEKHEEKERA